MFWLNKITDNNNIFVMIKYSINVKKELLKIVLGVKPKLISHIMLYIFLNIGLG